LAAAPDFSRWWRRRLLKVENWRPLQPWSQHWGLARDDDEDDAAVRPRSLSSAELTVGVVWPASSGELV
jgi:hypothetical protein